jgi:N-acetylmuramoyl-L-alanine amidase
MKLHLLRHVVVLTLGTALSLAGAASLLAQEAPPRLAVGGADPVAAPVFRHRGHAAVSLSTLESLGWRVITRGPLWRIRLEAGPELHLREESPFFSLGESRLQLVAAPYAQGAELYVPVQLVWDVLPSALPDRYATDERGILRVVSSAASSTGAARGRATSTGVPGARPPSSAGAPADRPRAGASQKLVVVIDPGHGGEDPGAIGPSGVREKDVALAIGVALARELARQPELEVHLTRDTDTLIPLWERGAHATRIKGDRAGIFISLHANALPRQRDVRGFETYFLSEARTEDERRVAANENAPLAVPRESQGSDPDLDFILRELRNLDHQHWSSLLAQMVQTGLDPVHPGTNRGVKQGPFAVITTALMPSVLIEVGFITHRDEERLLASPDFQDSVAKAIAGAVGKFLERYPTGRDASAGERP